MLDALVYAITVTGVAFAVGFVVSFSLGGGLLGTKYFLFLVGFVLFGYGAFQLRPSRAWNVDKSSDEIEIFRIKNTGDVIGSREETRFQSTVQRLPPLSWYSIPPEERFSSGAKLFLASIAILLTSFLMEAVFGVGV
ncbi:hypothetical protein [Haladaptatus sp. W1]|uniref:DUF7555 family protein n=1 Tax=Haladaptatus sp. W1 TaxID=1897478 RepID=UPI0020C7715A|nr:hypothetical protein [Haladaptatus sp. W1]